MGHRREPNSAWSMTEAKARFGQLVEKTRSDGPQTITRRGRRTAVVVAAEEWDRKTRRSGNLAEFFASSPLRGPVIKITRRKDKARRVDL